METPKFAWTVEAVLEIAQQAKRDFEAGLLSPEEIHRRMLTELKQISLCVCGHWYVEHNDFGDGKVNCDLYDCPCENFRPCSGEQLERHMRRKRQ